MPTRTTTEINKMRSAYWEDGKTLEEVGQMQNPPITRERVRQIFEEHGIDRRTRDGGRIKFSPEVRSEIVNLYKSGLSLAEVGNSLEPPVSIGPIKRVLQEEGVPLRTPGQTMSAKFDMFLIEQAPRLRAMEREGVSKREIGEIYGKSIVRIFGWFRRLNELEENSPNEDVRALLSLARIFDYSKKKEMICSES